jgi:DNA-binding response OmpR family regulator
MMKKRVLVVDNEDSIRRFVSARLHDEGYEVFLAADGEQAIKVLDKTNPELIILDILMPNMDGFEVCRRIRQQSQIPIIMLSAKGNEDDKIKCLHLGADDFVVKPFAIQELVARIEAVLRRSEVIDLDAHELGKLTQRLSYILQELEIKAAHYDSANPILGQRIPIRAKFGPLSAREMEVLQYVSICNRGDVE